ncbi:hypothetical protein [Cognatiluteimonas profundi]|uniref:hypothetical protein n=1 Tax=Cognatiluteimonas profundi TaxID=2594501 RepID=UPI00131BBB0C|nr:hypothetical protein [Lysobacter profundi]
MEFHIRLIGPVAGLAAIEEAIQAADPSALVDVDPSGNTLRIATSIDAVQLVSLVCGAGLPITPDRVRQLPSICCGGCSG